MIFGRVKPLDAILATAERKALHRTLGWFQLTLFGIGCVIGTGIFVLTAAGAQKAGPGLMLAFAIAGGICIVAALCYAEIAAMIPVAGSAYTYTYATMGEMLAWTVGWALILEYAVAASAVAVGWSGFFSGTSLPEILGVQVPPWPPGAALLAGRVEGRRINLPAVHHHPLHYRLATVGGERGGGVPTVHAHHQGVARQIQQLLGTENPAAFAQIALHGQARAIGFSERHLLTLHQGRGHHLKQYVVE